MNRRDVIRWCAWGIAAWTVNPSNRTIVRAQSAKRTDRTPAVAFDASWPIASNPDIGTFASESQQVVDFAVWQARDRTFQLWSCIRNTKAPGAGRLFHRWEGSSLRNRDWRPRGIAQTTNRDAGEWEGSLQAPYVVKERDTYFMFYGSGGRIFLQTSRDGKTFTRWQGPDGRSWVFGEEQGDGPRERDPMILRANNEWYAYYSGNPDGRGVIYVRTSSDLLHWNAPGVVSSGGAAGTNAFSAECPQVVRRNGAYYLFRTTRYGQNAQTMVYRSTDPMMFGINNDEAFLVATLPLAAPEIIREREQDYIAFLEPSLRGIRIAPLRWV